jgi:hypothetical protein
MLFSSSKQRHLEKQAPPPLSAEGSKNNIWAKFSLIFNELSKIYCKNFDDSLHKQSRRTTFAASLKKG